MKVAIASLLLLSLLFAVFTVSTYKFGREDPEGASTVKNLPILNADLLGVTVSGISSGAMMSAQMHIAHSAHVKGSGIVAGGPGACARGYLIFATTDCMTSPQDLQYSDVLDAVSKLAKQKKIDPVENIQGSQVYVYAGTKDTVVDPGCGLVAAKQFSSYGANLKTEFSIPSEHSYVTVNQGNACSYLGSPYINQCNYNQAFISLNHLFGGNLLPPTQAILSNLIEFTQSKFFDSDVASMASTAYIYVPTACASGNTKCLLHINFHGCEQSVSVIGTSYMTSSGLLEVAEANNIIILFPQTVKSSIYPYNPKGCWDWWGYTEWSAMLAPTGYYMFNSAGLNYLTQDGMQIKAIWKMAKQITQSV